MHIHTYNTAIAVCGVIINSCICVTAACINRYHIFTVGCFNRTLDLLNRRQNMKKLNKSAFSDIEVIGVRNIREAFEVATDNA